MITINFINVFHLVSIYKYNIFPLTAFLFIYILHKIIIEWIYFVNHKHITLNDHEYIEKSLNEG